MLPRERTWMGRVVFALAGVALAGFMLTGLLAPTGCEAASRGTIGAGELVALADAGRPGTWDARVVRDGDDASAPADGSDPTRDTTSGPGDTHSVPSDAPAPADGASDAAILRDVRPSDASPSDVPPGDASRDGAGQDTAPRDDAPIPPDVPVPTDAPIPADSPIPADVPAPEDAPSQPTAVLRVATWNVHFFWDDVCDSGNCAPGDFESELTPAEFADRADGIAAGVRGLGADVVCLEEVESQRGLDAVAARLGTDFPVVELGESGFAASLDVAAVARGTLEELRTHRSTPIPLPGGGTTRFARELLELHLRIDGVPVVVFCAHFKSQHGDEPDRRLAEAQAARDIVLATARERPEALVVLAGDLNDEPGSPPLDALEATGLLVRVAQELPGDAAATYWFDGPRALDHLFHAVGAGGRYLPGSVAVLTDRPNWLQYGGSDHAALRAAFEWPAREEER